MGIKRIVDVDFWNDDKVMEMFSPEDKLFMLYLLTNPHTTQLGIYSINVKHIAFEIGYSVETINILLERFEKKYNVIKYDYETKELAVKKYLVYSIIKGGAPVRDCLIKEMKRVKNKELIEYVFGSIKNNDLLNATVQSLIEEYEETNGEIKFTNVKEKSNKKENENENENENDVSYHDTYNDTLNDTSNDTFDNKKTEKITKKFKKPTLEEVKAYCFERNNNIDAENFINFYESKGWKVGKSPMKDWKACVRTWEKNSKPKQQQLQTDSWADFIKNNKE